MLEVGPGLGSLTLGLVATAEQVVVVEIDPVLAAALPATVDRFAPAARDRLLVVTADALRVTELPGDPPTQLVANLPYNVAVPVLLELIGRLPSLRAALVMVQLEVAQRLAAPRDQRCTAPRAPSSPGTEPRHSPAPVPPTVFWPQPRVGSGLVAWRRHPEPPGGPAAGGGPEREAVFAVIDAAFAQRRKTLRAALAQLAGGVDAAAAALARAGVDPGSRGEQLDVGAFAAVAAALAPRVRP